MNLSATTRGRFLSKLPTILTTTKHSLTNNKTQQITPKYAENVNNMSFECKCIKKKKENKKHAGGTVDKKQEIKKKWRILISQI